MTWKPAPSDGANRRPHGATFSVREACGIPVRIAVMASLSTSMAARLSDMTGRLHGMDRLTEDF
ncbi:hypothetical protein GCM10010168_34370 [Actinoplanes ianthinogenes]|uniref:Uncharacterized protein n=1 Tax=Actinoplanes ianthinogenes TaxID=122358 RepID=A0ABM7M5W9_9ACTN|nr:hypothetical protein [Actinoplanes ianthinogenes]BCJ47043.1 hypothetical protein Aiant_77000 [Actinoplanes ianthinogenes]GGR13697.1 hypothetical protein GCM10010168_34370 [Actinoplanes ianthinogenes]